MMIKYNYYHSIHTTHGWLRCNGWNQAKEKRTVNQANGIKTKEKRTINQTKGNRTIRDIEKKNGRINEAKELRRRRINQEKTILRRH